MSSQKDPYKFDGGYKKTISQLKEEALAEAKEAERLTNEQNVRLKSYDVVGDLFEASKKSKELNKSFVSTNVNFELDKDKVFKALGSKNDYETKYRKDISSDVKYIQRNAKEFYAVYDKRSGEYYLGYRGTKGDEHVLKHVSLDKNDVINLKSGKGLDRKDDGRKFFKGRISRSIDVQKERVGRWVFKNTVFKGRINKAISRITSKARTVARKNVSRFITAPLKNVFNKLTLNMTKKLGELLAKFSKSILSFLANPIVLGVIAAIVVVIFLLEAMPILKFDPETSKQQGYGESEKTGYEFLNRNYEEWSGIAEVYSKRYGVYFNVTDAFAIGVASFPALLQEDETINAFSEYFNFGYNVEQNAFAENIFMTMLGPMETRIEYLHRTWGPWENGFESKPSGFDQYREYTVTVQEWVEPIDKSSTYCLNSDFNLRVIAVFGKCPVGFEKIEETTTTPGYWVDKEVQRWDARRITEFWWDVKAENVANKNDGVVSNTKYSYTTAPDPKLDTPTCKDCKIINRIEQNGNFVRDVDYWTIHDWEEVEAWYLNNRPRGETFLKYFNYSTSSQVDVVDKGKYASYLNTLTTNSFDKDYKINMASSYLDFYKDLDYRKVSNGFSEHALESQIKNMNTLRMLFGDYFGSGEYNISLLGQFESPVQAVYEGGYTSHFGMRYMDGGWVFHTGLDIASSYGLNTLISSVMDGGEVIETFNECPTYGSGYGDPCGGDIPGTGNHVVVRYNVMDNSGQRIPLYVLYAHLKKDSIVVKVGDPVNLYSQIGFMGSSGSSTGIHLHLAVYVFNSDGSKGYMNPEFMIRTN